jgi:hypothetical protein
VAAPLESAPEMIAVGDLLVHTDFDSVVHTTLGGGVGLGIIIVVVVIVIIIIIIRVHN